MTNDEKLKRYLISKHLENAQGNPGASVQSFASSGIISGSFFLDVKELLNEYFLFKTTGRLAEETEETEETEEFIKDDFLRIIYSRLEFLNQCAKEQEKEKNNILSKPYFVAFFSPKQYKMIKLQRRQFLLYKVRIDELTQLVDFLNDEWPLYV